MDNRVERVKLGEFISIFVEISLDRGGSLRSLAETEELHCGTKTELCDLPRPRNC
jgi:hypothetical protein